MTVGDAALAAVDTVADADVGAVLLVAGLFLFCCVLNWVTP
jgi:polygalacturonase